MFNTFSVLTPLLWLVIGVLTSVAIHFLVPYQKEEIVDTLIAGIFGALAGGVMTGVIFGVNNDIFLTQSSVVAILGAFLFIFWQRTSVRKVRRPDNLR